MMFHWAVLLAMDWLRKLSCAATPCSLDCDPGGKGAWNRVCGQGLGSCTQHVTTQHRPKY